MRFHFPANQERPPRSFRRGSSALGASGLLTLVLFGSGLLGGALRAQNPDELKAQGYVNDFANVLSPSARDQLTALCTEVDQKAQAQIAVVAVKSLNGREASDYAFDLATHWGVGPKQKDRGVLILFAIDDHKYWTEVGYGLEGILPDGKVGSFGREAVPLLRANNYDAALLLVTRRIADVIAADRGVTLSSSAPAPVSSETRSEGNFDPAVGILVVIGLAMLVIYGFARASGLGGSSRSGHYRGGGWWIGPMMGGGFGGAGWGGGGFGGGGGGGGGGGFGGFGGGSFGGGGAGGSW